jgi:sulfur-carrier protein
MIIQVKLYASLRRFAADGKAGIPFEVDIDEGACLQDLVDCLSIPAGETKIAFVNGLVQDWDWELTPGDQVGIFPPVGGG